MEEDKNSYFQKGNEYFEEEEYTKAIEEYTKAIKLDKKYKEAYLNRGTTYYNLKQYEKAIEDFSKAIEIDEDYNYAYNNRGMAYANLKQYEKAIEDFTQAILLCQYEDAYYNRGLSYTLTKRYKKAIEDFNTYINISNKENLNQDNVNNQKKLDNLSLIVQYDLIEFIKKILYNNSLDKEEKKLLIKLTLNIMELLDNIKVDTKDKSFLHYTKSGNIKNLLNKKEPAKLRLSNAVYMNDPEEGKILNRILLKENSLEKYLLDSEDGENYTYLTCFCPYDKRDDLPMWINYAENGQGVSIIFKEEFFSNQDLYKVQYIDVDNFDISKDNTKTIEEIKSLDCYEKEEKLKELVEQLENEQKLKEYLCRIVEIIIDYGKGLDNKKGNNPLVKSLINTLLMYLSYVIKDKSYKYENEVRVIKFRAYEDEKVLDDNVNFSIPKLYTEYETPITSDVVDEIIVGPKGDFESISAYARYVGIKKVSKSKIKYR